MRHVICVVPEGIDDPARVSGGNVYDREVRDGLRARGWDVEVVEQDAAGEVAVPGADLVLIDGLCALRMPPHHLMQLRHQMVRDAAYAHSGMSAHHLMHLEHQMVSDDPGPSEGGRGTRVVVLAHMVAAAFPDATDADVAAERRAFSAASHVIVTSAWSARELERRRLVPRSRITVAAPGTHAHHLAAAQGRELLCVGVIAPHKGQDVLLAALDRLRGEDWTCTLAGSSVPSPSFAARIEKESAAFGGRVRMTGVLDPDALAGEYRRSAVVVAPSRVESAGMAIADARARGIPVIAADVGGIADTVAGGGAILVRPDDPAALARALGEWMTDPALRDRLRREAAGARAALPSWDDTIDRIEAALS